MAIVEQVDGPPTRAEAVTRQIMLEYLMWCAERLTTECGIAIDGPSALVAAHHREFTQELPHVLGPRGRLLVARADAEVVGVGALKPIDSTVVEIKRMYVRPQARGQGLGRVILDRLLADARAIGYQVARLETAIFMREAQAMYRSLGFQDRQIFDNAEASLSGLESVMLFMELRLDAEQPGLAACGFERGRIRSVRPGGADRSSWPHGPGEV